MSWFRKKQQSAEWLIVGLGNPGGEYDGTRHNVGFETIDLLAERAGIKLKTFKHGARYGVGNLGATSVCIAKPVTYMNLSGRPTRKLADLFNVKPARTLIISDDLDLPLAKTRLRLSGSPGGHNGHKSIVQALGTTEYPRIKIGVGKSGDAVEHVLSRFERHELEAIRNAIAIAAEGAELLVAGDEDRAMQLLNG